MDRQNHKNRHVSMTEIKLKPIEDRQPYGLPFSHTTSWP